MNSLAALPLNLTADLSRSTERHKYRLREFDKALTMRGLTSQNDLKVLHIREALDALREVKAEGSLLNPRTLVDKSPTRQITSVKYGGVIGFFEPNQGALREPVQFAFELIQKLAPVGDWPGRQKRPVHYGQSFLFFLNGKPSSYFECLNAKEDDQVAISNPMPYSRKIELLGFSIKQPKGVFRQVYARLLRRFKGQFAFRIEWTNSNKLGVKGNYAHPILRIGNVGTFKEGKGAGFPPSWKFTGKKRRGPKGRGRKPSWYRN